MHVTLENLGEVIAIISFCGGIAIYLFRKLVIYPLQLSIDRLNNTLKEFKIDVEKRMDYLENRVNDVEDKTVRHDEQIKSIFNNIGRK